MGIISTKSVGNTIYQIIDDLYPVHTADTGTIAISKLSGDIFTCDDGYIWSTYNKNKILGEIYSYNHNDTSLAPTVGAWFIPAIGATTPFTATPETTGFVLEDGGTSTPDFRIIDENIGRFLTVSNNTWDADNVRWNQYNVTPSRNNILATKYNYANFGTDAQNDRSNITSAAIFDLDARLFDSMFIIYRITAAESGTAYINRTDTKLSVNLIEEPVLFNENGVSKDFNTNGWSVVNDDTNEWVMGTGTTFSGGGTSIYISNDGSSNAYTNSTAQVSHFYKDIKFPKNLQTDVELSFYWKCNGESGLDHGNVYFTPTGVTPVAGTEVSSEYLVGDAEYNGQTNFTTTASTITFDRFDCIGQTKRFIFSWVNDGSGGSNPPMAIDSLRLHYYIDHNLYEVISTNIEDWESAGFSRNDWSIVNDSENIWVVGTAENSGATGSYAAYISDDGGVSASYNINNSEVSHFYRDFTFTGATTLEFDWKCWAEDNSGDPDGWDYGTVVITSTATTPSAGSEIITTAPVSGASETRIGAWSNDGKFNEGYGGSDNNWRHESINLNAYSGETKRIVFTWKNDGSLGDNPPFVVDNIRVTGIGNWAQALSKIN